MSSVRCSTGFLVALVAVCLGAFPAMASAQEQDQERGLNVLFLGNSLTQTNNIPDAFHDLVVAADLAEPHIGRQILWGRPLSAHVAKFAEDGVEKDVVATKIAEGQTWDFAVLQEYAHDEPHVERTSKGELKWPDSSVANAVKLSERIRDHSPKSKMVLYERWAPVGGRKEDGRFNRELTEKELTDFAARLANYRKVNQAAVAAVNEKFGDGTARMAPVGEGFAAYGYTGLFQDGLHQNNRGALLSAMMMYMTIYERDDLSDINVDAFLKGAWNKRYELTAADFETVGKAALKGMLPIEEKATPADAAQD